MIHNTVSPLYGAIIGDIIGSSYEGRTVRKRDFKLFTRFSRFTDDTILTLATANFIVHRDRTKSLADVLKLYYAAYPNAGYGDMFAEWARSDDASPNKSNGNGAVVRVSPIAFYYHELISAILARTSAGITHDNTEAIQTSGMFAFIVSALNNGYTKERIEDLLLTHYSLDEIAHPEVHRELRDKLSFDCSAKNTFLQSVSAFMHSNDFEGAIRNAVYIGGDTDTVAAMAGAMAVAYYKEIPRQMYVEAIKRLDRHLIEQILEYDSLYTGPKIRVVP